MKPYILKSDLCVNLEYSNELTAEISQLGLDMIALNMEVEYKDIKVTNNVFESIKNDGILKRCTIPIYQTDTGISNGLVQRLKKFDIVALRVDSNETLKSAIEINADLITFDFGKDFKIKHGLIREAIYKGIFFEIQTHLLFSAETRTDWYLLVAQIMEITKGRNLIITSNAYSTFHMKSAIDIYWMLTTFLSKKRAYAVAFTNPAKFLDQCATKRFLYKSTVMINDIKESGTLKKFFLFRLNKRQYISIFLYSDLLVFPQCSK